MPYLFCFIPDHVLIFAWHSAALIIGPWLNFVCLDILYISYMDPNSPLGYVTTLWSCQRTDAVHKKDHYLLSD